MRRNKTDNVSESVRAFLKGDGRKTVHGNYREEGSLLLYRASVTDDSLNWRDLPTFQKVYGKVREAFRTGDGRLLRGRDEKDVELETLSADLPVYGLKLSYSVEELLAVRVSRPDGSPLYLGNSGKLSHLRVSWHDNNESAVQKELSRQGVRMIPLSSLKGKDFSTFQLIQEGEVEEIEYETVVGYGRTEIVKQKFPGALLFSLEGEHYLFDYDREAIEAKCFNPFLSRLVRPVLSIADAYGALKPEAVLEAESRGVKVRRHSHWFFVPCEGPKMRKIPFRDVVRTLEAVALSRLDRCTVQHLHDQIASLLGDMPQTEDAKDLILGEIPASGTLRAKGHDSYSAAEMLIQDGVTYVRGVFGGSDYTEDFGTQWHRAVLNTTIARDLEEAKGGEDESLLPF